MVLLFLEWQREWKGIFPFTCVKDKSKADRKEGSKGKLWFLFSTISGKEILMNVTVHIRSWWMTQFISFCPWSAEWIFFVMALPEISSPTSRCSPPQTARVENQQHTSQNLGRIQGLLLLLLVVCINFLSEYLEMFGIKLSPEHLRKATNKYI